VSPFLESVYILRPVSSDPNRNGKYITVKSKSDTHGHLFYCNFEHQLDAQLSMLSKRRLPVPMYITHLAQDISDSCSLDRDDWTAIVC